MFNGPLDCVFVGYNEINLPDFMEDLKVKDHVSGAYRFMRTEVMKSGRSWTGCMDFLEQVLNDVTGEKNNLHPMNLPNMGLCYLKSYLAKRGFDSEIVNFYNRERDSLVDHLRKGPLAVAISTTFYSEPGPVREIVDFVRHHNDETVIIAGGPYVFNVAQQSTALRNLLFRKMGADIFIADPQGEAALVRVMQQLRKTSKRQFHEIPNLVWKRPANQASGEGGAENGGFECTKRILEDNDLDSNAIDWDLIPSDLCAPTVQIRTARGCAFRCSFCKFPSFAGELKLAGIHTVERELCQLREKGTKSLGFLDDTFNIPLPRFKKLLKMMIKNDFDFDWFSFLRCTNIDDEALQLMRESGCKGVLLGIESGDQTVLNNMNKSTSVEKYKEAIPKLKASGISVTASFIVGFPGETQSTAARTLDLIRETQPDYYHLHLYLHAADTPVQEKAGEFGLRGSGYSWSHETMDWRQAATLLRKMHDSVESSTLLPSYNMSFWGLLNLHGLGIPLGSITKYLQKCRPLLVGNSDAEVMRADESLRETGREIAGFLQRDTTTEGAA